MSTKNNFVFDLFRECFEVVRLLNITPLDFSDMIVEFLDSIRSLEGVEYRSLSMCSSPPFKEILSLLFLFPLKVVGTMLERLLRGLKCPRAGLLAGKCGGNCWLLSIGLFSILFQPFSFKSIASTHAGRASVL